MCFVVDVQYVAAQNGADEKDQVPPQSNTIKFSYIYCFIVRDGSLERL